MLIYSSLLARMIYASKSIYERPYIWIVVKRYKYMIDHHTKIITALINLPCFYKEDLC